MATVNISQTGKIEIGELTPIVDSYLYLNKWTGKMVRGRFELNVEDPLLFLSEATFTVPENEIVIGNIIATLEPTYSIVEGDDGADFEINETTGVLKAVNSFNYAVKSSYTLTVRATKGALTLDQTITITITDVPASEEIIKIGTQLWAKKNYDGVVTAMGYEIPEVTDNATWAALTTPAWCYYNNTSSNGTTYGKLYNWFALRKIQDDIDTYNSENPDTPITWRVNLKPDWVELIAFLGGAAVAGGKLKATGLTYWGTPNTGADNSSGFNALGIGRRMDTGVFASLQTYSEHHTYEDEEFTFYRLWKSDAAVTVIALTPTGAIAEKIKGGTIRLIKSYPSNALLDQNGYPVLFNGNYILV